MTTNAPAVRYDIDSDGIVTLTLDDPTQSTNTMNDAYLASMNEAVARILAASDEVTGVVITSAKKTFLAGGDLKAIVAITPANADAAFTMVESNKAPLRKLELLDKPVVAAINGATMGGGLELALAANHRIAVDGSYPIGLPEVQLGLLPGGGGITRTVRMFGLAKAIGEIIGAGRKFKPAAAKEIGLIDEVVATREELLPAAKAWIKANPEAHTQPWDIKGFKLPGGAPGSPQMAAYLPVFAPMLRKQLRQADYRAPKAIVSAAIEGAQVDFDTASRIESRYFAKLATGQQAKNMIQAFFFDLQSINAGGLRPAGVPTYRGTKVGVLGAGMMGAGIAYVCAQAGMEVVLKDVTLEAAERGKAYTANINDRAISRGKLSQEKSDELLALITPTSNPADLTGCDLVIEAVFEDVALKQNVFAEVAPYINNDALLCSNTSTLPITDLAKGIDRPTDFIGMHFFSPVDKMPLVEIIRGADTSDEALAKAYDVVLQIRKTPIVVNDSRGFFTSRVICTRIEEGLALLDEGVHPLSIERAATQAGYPVGPLQLADELNLELLVKIASTTREASGSTEQTVTERVCYAMIDASRAGKLRGAGFYDYADGRRGSIWNGLSSLFPPSGIEVPIADLRDRMLVREALETAHCIEEGVLMSAAHANVGSILGIGFPGLTGGAAQYMTGFEAADGSVGLAAFIDRADELADAYGEHLRPTPYLRGLVETGTGFPA
ncbi:3-hydroxyacyl-CoA dehydrogenase NAD-binding domain-containing protein [Nocardioides cavernaquae]|uniref:3-hydroxyacyl-CoA dehydrogenase n=1 Tax=Nocardioides cavernaquae TaxID=2321396 RepID=A0A3A5H7T4_9ACTN|nr:3-hydroxyacyl-CoA dehydrogenase NAD-binding domain-containing protein [Nocardioides cavernaquae]RJS46716.1 3-hydroxyacyl-CoA dehydrogenase [Nocardioides cavernaquae]